LFRSTDGGRALIRWRFKRPSDATKWAALGTPDGEFLHSILVDRATRDLYIGISVGGVVRVQPTPAATGARLNDGCGGGFPARPEAAVRVTIHTGMVQHPGETRRLYQQNHCGNLPPG